MPRTASCLAGLLLATLAATAMPLPAEAALTRDADAAAAPKEAAIDVHLGGDVCLTLAVPAAWSLRGPRGAEATIDTPSGASLVLHLHDTRQTEPAAGALLQAAALERTYQDLVGKPAQAVNLRPLPSRLGWRWTATWIDTHLPNAGGAYVAEAFLLPAGPGRSLALTVHKAGSPEAYETLAARAVAAITAAAPCAPPAARMF